MAPTQQSAAAATTNNNNNNSDLTTKSTCDFANSVHKMKKESYNSSSSSISSSSHNDTAHSSINSSRLFDATQQETLLPISSKGHFFHDAFFEDARQHFEAAVRNVLDLRGHGRSGVHDDLTSYRMLRQTDLSEGSQAATVTENNTCHQVVMDVRDFMAGDVKVKVVDEDEVVVEGSVEQRSGGSVSKKSFRRSFTFPGLVKAADIASTMSSDGVLTVTVPKKKHVAHITNITIQESNTSKNTSVDKIKSNTSAQNTKMNSSKSNTVTENTKTNTVADNTNTLAQSAHQTSATTHSQSSSSVASNATTVDNSVRRKSREFQQANVTSAATTDAACTKPRSNNGFSTQPSDLLLPISHGGLFFQDSFFAQAHQEFEEAMKKVLHAAGESPKADVMTSYRSLRQRHLTNENQAVSLSEDSQHHKVVMDVRDFMAGEVKVKVVDEDEVVVEGSVEQKSGGSVSKKSFRRSFTFPGLVKAADITSTMSSDGVLNFMVPKKELFCNVRVFGNSSKTRDAVTTEKKESTSSINSSSSTVKESSSKASVRDEASSVHVENSVSSGTIAAGDKQQQQQQQEEVCAASQESATTILGRRDATRESSWVLDSLLPVFPKGPFFHDSFFEESRQHFEAAVKEALGRLGQEEESQADDFSLYRSLRAKNMTDESQAVKVTEDEHSHQVVLDVRDFQGGDVQVKVVGSSEVQVEGRLVKEEGGCKSSRSFRRRFHLPGVLDVDAVTSALSSDGVLTIKAPKGRAAAGKSSC